MKNPVASQVPGCTSVSRSCIPELKPARLPAPKMNGVPAYEILDTEVFKYIADLMVHEAGVVPLLHCPTVDAIMEGDTIRGVVTESKSGRQAILAKRVIDATGDADIAFRAGVPYHQEPKEKLSAVTVNFGCSGVDLEKFQPGTPPPASTTLKTRGQ